MSFSVFCQNQNQQQTFTPFYKYIQNILIFIYHFHTLFFFFLICLNNYHEQPQLNKSLQNTNQHQQQLLYYQTLKFIRMSKPQINTIKKIYHPPSNNKVFSDHQPNNQLYLDNSQIRKQMQFHYKNNFTQQLQGIYYGTLNVSHQKHGFGIYRTDDFDTYFGYFRNNHLEGQGLIVYENGLILYSQKFFKDIPNGVTILDNPSQQGILFCGTVVDNNYVGVSFQYTYATKLWQMIQRDGKNKRVIVEQIKDIKNKPPKIMRTEIEFYRLMEKYIEKNFFIDQKIYHQNIVMARKPQAQSLFVQQTKENTYIDKNIKYTVYGYLSENNFPKGPVILFQNYQLKQISIYNNKGFKQGFCMNFLQNNQLEIGNFKNGLKQGLFQQYKNNHKAIVTYSKNNLIKTLPMTSNTSSTTNLGIKKGRLKQQQKLSHINSKYFISIKHHFKLRQISLNLQMSSNLFGGKSLRILKRKKSNMNSSLSKSLERSNSISISNKNKPINNKQPKIIQKSSQKSNVNSIKQPSSPTKNIEITQKKNHKMSFQLQNQSETCLQRIKKKIPHLLGLVENQEEFDFNQQNDRCEVQQNPFSFRNPRKQNLIKKKTNLKIFNSNQ